MKNRSEIEETTWRISATPWSEKYGHHRAVVTVHDIADAVTVHVPWRRRDDVNNTRVVVVDSDGHVVPNVFWIRADRDSADLAFGPVAPGEVAIYYRPYHVKPGSGEYESGYLPPEDTPDSGWVARHQLVVNETPAGLASATLVALESRTEFDHPYPMGVPMTEMEHRQYLETCGEAYHLFAEDRTRSIRMKSALPIAWRSGPQPSFKGTALRHEYYVMQIGVYAARQSLRNVILEYSGLSGDAGAIAASAFTCFNIEGVDADGRAFIKTVDVSEGQVQPLWIGIDLPETVMAGIYTGTITVRPENAPAQVVSITLEVAPEVIEARGDHEAWRMSRIRWINSTRGLGDTPVTPYTPVSVKDMTVSVLGRSIELGANGLPAAVTCSDKPVLAGAARWVAETEQGACSFTGTGVRFTEKTEGHAAWESSGKMGEVEVVCRGSMEFDGFVHFYLTLSAQASTKLDDLRLEIPFREDVAEYMNGMGGDGAMPQESTWQWGGPQDSFWIGNHVGGIFCQLRGATYHGPMLNLYRPAPPPSWHNDGKGGLRVAKGAGEAMATAFSGARTLLPGEPVTFEFVWILTPVKPLNVARHFSERYYHNANNPAPTDGDLEAGVKVINVHHGNEQNPYINYPFVEAEKLRNFIDTWHDKGCKVKIYFTLRELTNHLPELWFLRSLGDEVLCEGRGGGFPWLREHLEPDYASQWYHHFEDGRVCAALKTAGETRWYNFYVEGVHYLVQHLGADGLYLDDVSFDRRILKRIRRVMEAAKPGACRIDLHSNTAFSKGPANKYMDFYPYIDKTWYGECFNYDDMMPDQWFVRCASIPYGLMSEMLMHGGNRWLGMVYGMTNRRPWMGGDEKDPRHLWRFWDRINLMDATMVGYWDAACPVQTDDENIKATAYVLPDKTLIAIGSWSPNRDAVNLTIDWKALGLEPGRAVLLQPAIEWFQDAQTYKVGEPIPVENRKGKLIMVQNNSGTTNVKEDQA